MTAGHSVLAFGFALVAYASEEGAGAGAANTTKPYVRPEVEGLHWVETFDGDVWSRWSHAEAEKFGGKFEVQRRRKEALVGDLGLLVPDEAKHYGVAVTFAPLKGRKGVPFVVQFEARFQDGLSCGGSYIKLFDSEGMEARKFKDSTPYVIMFGPDRCGGTDKVHFILQHRSPKTGKLEEKHFKEPPGVPHDQLTHLYRLVVSPDNSFEIAIDGEMKASGSLLTSMEPPVNPPKEIDDPADSKPTDWIDEAKMDDPTSTKPEDWDEDAPMMIADPKATMPSGWREDEPAKIPDPTAQIPEDWDEDEDGEWEAPIIENPVCKVGCGKWEAPKISNPAYKGKWHAMKIDNPAYKGVWRPRQVENPDYFVDEAPCVLPKIDAVGIDIWTMSKGVLFDNLVISTDVAKAKAFADQSWAVRHELEKLQEPKKAGKGDWWGMLSDNLAAISVTCGVVLLTAVWCCCFRGGSAQPKPPAAARKAPRKKETSEGSGESNEPSGQGGDGKQKHEGGAGEAGQATQKKEEKVASEPASSAKPAAEGGLGDISGDS